MCRGIVDHKLCLSAQKRQCRPGLPRTGHDWLPRGPRLQQSMPAVTNPEFQAARARQVRESRHVNGAADLSHSELRCGKNQNHLRERAICCTGYAEDFGHRKRQRAASMRLQCRPTFSVAALGQGRPSTSTLLRSRFLRARWQGLALFDHVTRSRDVGRGAGRREVAEVP